MVCIIDTLPADRFNPAPIRPCRCDKPREKGQDLPRHARKELDHAPPACCGRFDTKAVDL